jgi:hypothetical protein
MKILTEALQDLASKTTGDEKTSLIYARNYIIAMTEAIQQIKEEADQAMREDTYAEEVLHYSDEYGDNAFSGLSRAADILDDKMRKISFVEAVSRAWEDDDDGCRV